MCIQKWVSGALFMVICSGVVQPVWAASGVRQSFWVTAYYSPLPDQSFYITGDYESEKRLNGNGTNGASGRPVFSGMLAAPKKYAFGTKIKLDGVGVGTVADRGGAIVEKGERGFDADRIDIWVGSGEDGLKRALTWGKRKLVGTVYEAGTALADTIVVESFAIADREWPTNALLFYRNFGRGDKGEDVKKLQQYLMQMGYEVVVTGVYDEPTINAVYDFQIKQGIIQNDQSSGAGYFGTKTRLAMQKQVTLLTKQQKEIVAQKVPDEISQNAVGDDVRKLQKELANLGYDVPVTGFYGPQTVQAVLKFQMDRHLVSSADDRGAGNFGPATRDALVQALMAQTKLVAAAAPAVLAKAPSATPVAVVTTPEAPALFPRSLGKGDRGEAVKKLQETLALLGYKLSVTGVYDAATVAVVQQFQLRHGVVASVQDRGVGYCGLKTRLMLSAAWQNRDREITYLQKITPNYAPRSILVYTPATVAKAKDKTTAVKAKSAAAATGKAKTTKGKS